MSLVTIKEGKHNRIFEDEEFPSRGYPWDDFQVDSFQSIKDQENVLVCAPTASGKTTVAEYALIKHLLKGGKVIYTTPIKVLSNEKYNDLKKLLEPYGISPGLVTGDHKQDLDSPILVATAEILKNSLYLLKQESKNEDIVINNEFVKGITCVIIDEVHYINDPDRGHVWEETLTLIDPSIQLVMLSATISKPEEFASWIAKIKNKKISVIKKMKRPVPLNYFMYSGSTLDKIVNSEETFITENYTISKEKYNKKYFDKKSNIPNRKDDLIKSVVRYCKNNDLMQVLIIFFSKSLCEEYARKITMPIIEDSESFSALEEYERKLLPVKSIYENLDIYEEIKRFVRKGICYHHAGLPTIFKEVIEHLYKNGFIKVLFSTETFAVGVNMPVRTLVLTSLEKPGDGGIRNLRPDEFKQICGRAGRRGLDPHGNAILLPFDKFYEIRDIKNLVYGKMPSITSTLEVDYNMFLKLKQSMIKDTNMFYSDSLKNEQDSKGLDGFLKEINELKLKLSAYNFDEENEDIKKLIEYNKLVDLEQGKSNIFGITQTMSKSDRKKLQKLRPFYEQNKELFKDFKHCEELKKEIFEKTSEYDARNGGISRERYDKLSTFCRELNLLNDVSELTLSGIIASQINQCECTPLLLKIFNEITNDPDLTAHDIVAITSILIEKSKDEEMNGLILGSHLSDLDISVLKHTNEYDSKGTVNCNQKIRNIVRNIQEYIDYCEELESQLHIYHKKRYWEISLRYIEISYKWSTGSNISEILNDLKFYNEGLGIFVKNMLKIYNILNELKCIASDVRKSQFIDVLETAKDNIFRDVVNTISLYLIE